MTCRFTTSTEPRVVIGRHLSHCADQYDTDSHGCRGCQPCHEPHCRVCGHAHTDGTCAECLAETREALHDIGRKCDALSEEVEHRGINSEAATLWGPSADPEARQYVEASYLAGRLPEGWIEAAHGRACPLLVNDACVGCAGGELHPLTVLGTWQMVIADALEHDLGETRVTITTAVAYLDRQMTYLAGYEHVPFEDFARDLRLCDTHLASVLHDQERGVRANIPCFDCGADLERRLSSDGFEDHWTCRGCRRRYTIAEYNFALRASLEEASREVPA